MFSLKFKSYDWKTEGNKTRYIFLLIAVAALTIAAVLGAMKGVVIAYMARSLVAIILLYIIISIVMMYVNLKKARMQQFD